LDSHFISSFQLILMVSVHETQRWTDTGACGGGIEPGKVGGGGGGGAGAVGASRALVISARTMDPPELAPDPAPELGPESEEEDPDAVAEAEPDELEAAAAEDDDDDELEAGARLEDLEEDEDEPDCPSDFPPEDASTTDFVNVLSATLDALETLLNEAASSVVARDGRGTFAEAVTCWPAFSESA
jgi:hypothetical protein